MSVLWFGNFAIIKARRLMTNRIYVYAGSGVGVDKEQDIKYIICWGHKYPIEGFRELLRQNGIL